MTVPSFIQKNNNNKIEIKQTNKQTKNTKKKQKKKKTNKQNKKKQKQKQTNKNDKRQNKSLIVFHLELLYKVRPIFLQDI